MILLCISLIGLTGCPGGEPQPLQVYVGTEGVAMKFVNNLPPSEVYQESEVPVTLELWNKGAYPLNTTMDYAVISLQFDPVYFKANEGFIQVYEPYYIEGKSIVWPSGERDFLDMARLKVNKIEGTIEMPKTTVSATICYPYQTVLTQEVCIDADIYGTETNPLCRNQKSYSYPQGQGAPVIVSKLESEMLPAGISEGIEEGSAPVTDEEGHLIGLGDARNPTKKVNIQPSFNIFISNLGEGLVFINDLDKSVREVCELTSPKDKSDINEVEVSAKLGGQILICSPERVKLFNGIGQTRCSVPRENIYAVNRNYMDILTIRVDYLYMNQISKQIRINRLS